MDKIRLNKFLAHSGIASRRKVEDIIISESVRVNGKITILPQTLIDPDVDTVKVNDKVVKEEKKYYFILNKPKGFICSNQINPNSSSKNTKKPHKNKKSSTKKSKEHLVIDLFKDYGVRLFTVGRLDKDTTGLLIVTNDGDFANKVIHPSSNLEKEYFVKVKENLLAIHLKKIKKGTFVENKFVKPKKVIKTTRKTMRIMVTEGKKREIKIFIQKANLTLFELQRVRIGNLKLENIPFGYYKRASLEEVSKIF